MQASGNLLSFEATGSRVVPGRSGGTYADDVRDDRGAVLTSDGHQVVTLQDSGKDGSQSVDECGDHVGC